MAAAILTLGRGGTWAAEVAVPAATTPAVAPAKGASRDTASSKDDYQLGPEDVLDIVVWNNTNISRTVPVRPDGKISLPLLNDVQVVGLTPMQLREVLVKRLAEYMSDPEVSVIVREVHSLKVSVIGAVKKPGRYELRSHATVLDLLAQAEGVNEFASRSRILILRPEGATTKRIQFNYNRVVDGNEQENFMLRSGDIVVVP